MPKKREIPRRDIKKNKFIIETKRKEKKKARWNSQTGRLESDKKMENGKRKRNPVEKSKKESDDKGSKERSRGKRETNRKGDSCIEHVCIKRGKYLVVGNR